MLVDNRYVLWGKEIPRTCKQRSAADNRELCDGTIRSGYDPEECDRLTRPIPLGAGASSKYSLNLSSSVVWLLRVVVDGVSISFILAHKRFIVNNAYGRVVYHKMHKLCTKPFDLPVENYLYSVEKRRDLWPTTISYLKTRPSDRVFKDSKGYDYFW
jgi:hypothetical protein